MTKASLLVLALAGVVLPGLPLGAAPAATQVEADRLKSVFERYVGHPAAGQAGSVAILPEGMGYRASFDYGQMLRPFESFGVSVEPATQTFLLTPNDDGTWLVAGSAMPPVVLRLKDQTIAIRGGAYAFDGTFDPKLGIFTRQTVTQDGSTLDQDAPALSQHRRAGHTQLGQTAATIEADRASADLHYTMSDVTADISTHAQQPEPTDDPAAPPAAAPMRFSYTLARAVADIHLDRLRSWGLLDLWAFLVAHPSRDALTSDQEQLRGLLRAARPVLAGFKEDASADTLALQTPFGPFRADRISGSVDLSGLSSTGTLVTRFAAEGLALPNLTLPAWSTGFLPTSIDIRPGLTGFHLDEAAHAAVDGFDLKHEGLSSAQNQVIGRILWPGDGTVTLAPSRVTTPLLDIRLDGQGTVGPVPAGRLTITGTGFDKAVAVLRTAAATDDSAAQILAQVLAVKTLGKANPDGSLVWVVEAAANQSLSVNGIPLK